MTPVTDSLALEELRRENQSFRERLQVAEDTLQAIRRGEVDSLVTHTPGGIHVLPLPDVQGPYRIFVEEMQQGAAALGPDGTVLYCNRGLPALLRTPSEQIVGATWRSFAAPESEGELRSLLDRAAEGRASAELTLIGGNGTRLLVFVTARMLTVDGVATTCLIFTDLSDRRRAEQALRQAGTYSRGRIETAPARPAAVTPRPTEQTRICRRDLQRSAAAVYATAFLAVAVALVSRWLFWGFLGTTHPYLLLWPAVMVAAWYGGFRGGGAATLLGAVSAVYFVLRPPFSLAISDPAQQFGVAVFLILGTAVSVVCERMRRTESARLEADAAARSFRIASTYNRSLIEASLDPLVAIGPDGTITDVNAATEAATGRGRDELIGSDFAAYFTEPARARAGWQQIFREGVVRDFALELRHRDGHTTPVLYNAALIKDDTDRVVGVHAAARDITELKRAEAALTHLATVVQSSHDAIITKSLDGTILSWNRGAERLYGYTAGEAIGRHISLIVPPERSGEVESIIARAQADEVIEHYQTLRRCKDGRLIPVSVSFAPLREPGGRIVAFASIGRDISKLVETERSLRKSEDSLNRAQAVAHIGSWHLDFPRNELAWSQEAYRIFGVSAGTPLSYESFLALVHPDDRAAVDRAWKAATAGARYDIQHRLLVNGQVKWARQQAQVIFDAAGHPVEATGITHDITDLKRAEDESRRASAYNRSLIEASLDPLVTIGPDGTITDVNAATEAATGCPREELIGTDFSQYFTEPDKAQRSYQSVFQEGSVRDYALVIRHRDGSLTPVLYNAALYRDEAGEPLGVLAAARNVSAQKKAEEQLRRVNRALRALSHCNETLVRASDEIALLEDVCRIVCEDAGYRMCWVGYAEDDAGKSVRPVAWAGAGTDYLEDVGITWAEEERGQGPTGTAIRSGRVISCMDIASHPRMAPWREAALAHGFRSSIALPLGNGEPAMGALTLYASEPNAFVPDEVSLITELAADLAFGIRALRDRGERARVVEELRRSEERFALVAQGTSDGIWDWDLRSNTVYFSPRYLAMLGYEEGELAGSYEEWEDRLHPEDRSGALATLQGYLEGRLSRFEVEFRMRKKDGSYCWVLGRGIGLRDSEGKVFRMAGSHLDLTERKQAEAEVQRLNEELEDRVRQRTAQLEEANRELEAFAYSVSHDLRAPLRAIDGFSQALLEDCYDRLDEQGRGYLGRVRAGAQRMGGLIDDILHLSRTTRAEVRRAAVNLGTIARKVAAALGEAEPGRKVELVISDEGCAADADPGLMEVVLQNLLGNAWKFTSRRPDARIEVGSARLPDGGRAFFVRDNGAGFDMAYADKLFGVFQRLHTPEEFPGNGVGLATVKRIVHKHGGRVWAEGAVGQGATFYFTL